MPERREPELPDQAEPRERDEGDKPGARDAAPEQRRGHRRDGGPEHRAPRRRETAEVPVHGRRPQKHQARVRDAEQGPPLRAGEHDEHADRRDAVAPREQGAVQPPHGEEAHTPDEHRGQRPQGHPDLEALPDPNVLLVFGQDRDVDEPLPDIDHARHRRRSRDAERRRRGLPLRFGSRVPWRAVPSTAWP